MFLEVGDFLEEKEEAFNWIELVFHSASVLLVLLEIFKGIDSVKLHLTRPERRRPSDWVVMQKGME